MPPLEGSVQLVPLLNDAEAARACDAVHGLRPHWIQRDAVLPFYTLGAASYLDATGGRFAAYQERARACNGMLAEHFGWLHERLAQGFGAVVGAPVSYCEALALPGFHVFLAHRAFTQPTASLHYDLQYQSIDWSGIAAVDAENQRSLTLSVRLPAGGGGLRIWDIDVREMNRLTAEEQRDRRAANRRPTYVPYAVGSLVVHSGHHLHQIAPLKDHRPEDERITLQAHAASAGDRWVLYW